MLTADKTTNNNANVLRGSLPARLVIGYRWAFSVFSRRNSSKASNDLQGLNAHQLRDLGVEDHRDKGTSHHMKLEQAKLNALRLLTGVKER